MPLALVHQLFEEQMPELIVVNMMALGEAASVSLERKNAH
jgi:hypothetical protein